MIGDQWETERLQVCSWKSRRCYISTISLPFLL